ncbi:MAG: hypothetical protein SF052_17995 [Bacteroidia bacterium]|nr:hypothetical protein [Bacteroidia bacterium]
MAKQQETNLPEKSEPIPVEQVINGDAEKFLNSLMSLLNQTQIKNAATSTVSNDAILNKINEALIKTESVAVAFPPCSDVMLGLTDNMPVYENNINNLSVNHFFAEYFSFVSAGQRPHQEIPNGHKDRSRLDNLLGLNPCLTNDWPPQHCLPSPCILLEGNRRIFGENKLKRLFIGDLAWLYYIERMGTFQMLGRILEEYAYQGGIPMSNGSVHADVKDDMVALVLEAMTRQTESGNSSKVRDRDAAYRRSFGWTTEAGRSMSLNSSVNTAFGEQFHKFMYLALQFFKDKRLGTAIRATNNNIGITSTATLVTIRDTISLLKKSFDNFNYGRNYHTTLSGIVWAIAGLKLVEELRQTLGIPPEYTRPSEYIPAAFRILVTKSTVTTSNESNRFETHIECARNLRSILLDMEVLNFSDASVGGELEQWLNAAESSIEGYRTAYRTLTGVDLETSQTPVIEQGV